VNGISIFQLIRDQFVPRNVPPSVARGRLTLLQALWIVCAVAIGLAFYKFGDRADAASAILAANAIFTALSLTMAMFFWPKAINLKNDPELLHTDARWYVYLLTTQLFWTVIVGISATGATILSLAIESYAKPATAVLLAVCVGLTAYQVLLLGQSVFRLYAATFWLARS
jgi:hypothetical protein